MTAIAASAELLPEELRAALAGDYVRVDRVAEARGRLRRGEAPPDEELARAIVASAQASRHHQD